MDFIFLSGQRVHARDHFVRGCESSGSAGVCDGLSSNGRHTGQVHTCRAEEDDRLYRCCRVRLGGGRYRLGRGRISRGRPVSPRFDLARALAGQGPERPAEVADRCRYGFRIFAGILAVLLLIPLMTGIVLVPKDTPHPTDRSVDWIGGGLFTVANFAIMLAFTLGVDHGWRQPCKLQCCVCKSTAKAADVPTLFGVAILSAALFVWRQYSLYRSEKAVPLVPPRLITGKGKSRLNALYVATILTWCGQDVRQSLV